MNTSTLSPNLCAAREGFSAIKPLKKTPKAVSYVIHLMFPIFTKITQTTWTTKLSSQLKLFFHRNWKQSHVCFSLSLLNAWFRLQQKWGTLQHASPMLPPCKWRHVRLYFKGRKSFLRPFKTCAPQGRDSALPNSKNRVPNVSNVIKFHIQLNITCAMSNWCQNSQFFVDFQTEHTATVWTWNAFL